MSDQIFQKLKLKIFLLHKTGNIVPFYWIKHPSWSCLKLSFIASAVYAKIIALSFIKFCPVLSCKNGPKWPKMLSSARIRTRVLPERKQNENFLSKALPLSHGGITLNGDKSTKEFPISKLLLINIGHALTYHYNGCQNAKNGYIL